MEQGNTTETLSIPHHEKDTGNIMQVGILEQHTTKVGLSLFMTVSRVNSEWCEDTSCLWSAENVRRVSVEHVDVSDTTKWRDNSTNPETGIFYWNFGPETEM